MFRVIYRWEVLPKDFDDFRRVWRVTTNRIHESVPGALGSLMLRANDRHSEVLTVAKWESEESWRRFWGNQDPEEMQGMRKLGKRVSVETYNEVDDYTR
ncbi:MAG: antibiotic biosynthesis monooxygenase [Gammaproteobacteria bacterium]|nr:antibiotic biosynthesis monooxygenase [Gammaproteobacteria bacterium]